MKATILGFAATSGGGVTIGEDGSVIASAGRVAQQAVCASCQIRR